MASIWGRTTNISRAMPTALMLSISQTKRKCPVRGTLNVLKKQIRADRIRASSDRVVYFFITLSSMRALPLNSEKQPGEQSTQPIMCSVAFCSQ